MFMRWITRENLSGSKIATSKFEHATDHLPMRRQHIPYGTSSHLIQGSHNALRNPKSRAG
ncbi:hypothetical protein HNR29_006401 [Rhizobium leguminosarum]|nr:hypothetical protein [Rhizobium leguminosarum]